ncbi:hypothetical protein [Nocardioides coralli]|uniref:hypothetical protein n=1 Tax=Nocardioides coralli TaxID=2872154 RepID=UPI001CA3EEF8|nr:hypothetical protein [Nocardioides coralli]QZY30647.1 hypothetical protein K6T13_08440 [Nocardioides coralli]
MRVLSTVDAWLDVAHLSDPDQRIAGWSADYEAAFPSVFEVYYRSWGSHARRVEAAKSAPTLIESVRRAEGRAIELLQTAEQDFRDHGLIDGDDLNVVLMVGGRSSNGWVADHEGQPTLFLALEYLGLSPYDDLLVVHELTHVAQQRLSADARDATYTSALALLVEGSAVTTTRLLRPGFSDSAYLWSDEEHGEWVSRCEVSAPRIARLVLDHLDTLDDDEGVAPLFRNREHGHVPARAGYWAGDQIAQALVTQGIGLSDLLAVDAAEGRRLAARWGEQLA